MPIGVYPRPSPEQRFWSKVNKTETCWLWDGGRDKYGYGSFWLNGSIRKAYRVSYEWSKGPIPKGLELDHICRNPSCINPNHLEAVTHQENCSRGEVGKKTGEKNRQKTHCPQGHPYNDENTYIRHYDKRDCRTCSRERMRKRKGWNGGLRNIDKTHCLLGHPFSGDNLHIRPSGARTCMACHSITQKRYRARRSKSDSQNSQSP